MTTAEHKQISEIPGDKFIQRLYRENETHIAQLRKMLHGLDLPRDACILAIGSDGKKERHIQSKTELIIVTKDRSTGLRERMLDHITSETGEQYDKRFDTSVHTGPEVKSLSEPVPLSFAYPDVYSKPHRVFPDRVLNTQIVAGSTGVYLTARENVLVEMGARNTQSHKIRRHIREQVASAMRIMNTGMSRNVHSFVAGQPHLEYGIQHYNENPNTYTTGFKEPFLRGVQRTIDLLTARLLVSQATTSSELAFQFPTPTISRIQYLRRTGLQDIPVSVEDSFAWFLQQYHRAQQAYLMDPNRTAQVPFNLESFQHHKNVVLNFISSVLDLSIAK
jgi:hypothetical protein